MSFQACNWASEQRVGDPVLKLLLLTLANYAGPNGEASWYSQAKMSYDTEIPDRSLRRYLQKLVEMELISVEPRTNADGTKTTSLITVLMRPAANLAGGYSTDHRPNPGVTTGQNGGAPSANKVAGQESPKNNQEKPLVLSLPLDGQLKPPKPKKIKHQIPKDFAITEDHICFAGERNFDRSEARFMFDKFKAYHQGKGSLMLDWNACWRTWVLNQVGFRDARDPSNHKPYSNNPII